MERPGEASESESARSPLDALVLECLERFESEGDAAVDELCRAHPQHASALRSRLATLRAAGLISAPAGAEPEKMPERLGDFRLLECLGGGGMGVVYRAIQESLSREVALKLIRPDHLYFPGSRARFQREVRAVARLNHPGIVPVYTVGEERGIPYFAMERVPGLSLGDALKGFSGRDPESLSGRDLGRAVAAAGGGDPDAPQDPLFQGSWVETCSRIVREAADALEHAHRRGVLHRDVKPSNVMVTREGRVVLLDFGLSLADAPGDGAAGGDGGHERLTVSGAQLGSLPYMAPEQARGDHRRVSRATDVYGLGVTLYELLTLRLPYLGPTREATQAQILAGRPKAPRAWNAQVSDDLETVCLTAMDPEPARRYATAAELAQDVTNVLERRPIRARRAGALLRLLRLVQRHPAASLAVVFGVLALVGAPTLLYLQQRRANEAIRERSEQVAAKSREVEETNLRLEAARANAEQNHLQALKAVDLMLTRVADEALRDVPQMEVVRRELLEDALRLNQELAAAAPADRAAARLAAQARQRLGSIQRHLGRLADAEEALLESEREHRALLAADSADPPDPETQKSLLNVLTELAHVAEARGKQEECVRRADAAAALVLARVAEPASADLRVAASMRALQANALVSLGRHDEAAPVFEEAVAAARRAVAGGGEDEAHVLASVLCGAARLHIEGRLDDESAPRARALLEEAITTLDARLETSSFRPRTLTLLADATLNLGILHQLRAEDELAVAALRRALDVTSELRRDFPSVPRYVSARTVARCSLGALLSKRPEGFAEARVFLEAAASDQEDLILRAPASPLARIDLATVLNNLGVLELREGKLDEAVAVLERAIVVQREAVRLAGDNAVYRDRLGEMALPLADAHLRVGDHQSAARVLDEAVPDLRVHWLHQRRLAGLYAGCAAVAEQDEALPPFRRQELADGHRAKGLERLARAIELGYRDAPDLDQAPALAALRTSPRFEELREALRRAQAADGDER